jgi:hypothetical protein
MRRASLAALAVLAALLPLVAMPLPARGAAAYSLATRATYTLNPEARRIDVAVAATFENTTPNPPGQFSVFDSLKLAVQDGASAVTARDAAGALGASVARENGVNVVTVKLRTGIRYQRQVDVGVSYQLADGAAPGLRARPSAVVFPAWGFGTASAVTVQVPSGYEVKTDGDTLSAAAGSAGVTLVSGAIADPSHWLAMVTATHATAYATTDRSIALDGGTMDLQVRSFDDDPAWGATTADLLVRAMPLVQQALGLPYLPQGPVVVTESVAVAQGGISEGGSTSPELLVAFDQPAFTLVHQAAHLWLSPALASDRWIREGLASWVAAEVGAQLHLDRPYDPAARVTALATAAFPLESWGAGAATPDQDAYGYAASWQLMDEIASRAGADTVRAALRRIEAGRSAYDPVEIETPPTGALPDRPVDSRRFLDHLEAVSRSTDLATRYAALVLPADAAGELGARQAARQAYAGLLARAGSWGGPAPVTSALAAWDFPTATSAMAAATDWLGRRDSLLSAIGEAGLTTPNRLRERYLADGGGTDATTELEAERAVVDAYRAALIRSVADRPFLARIGLLAGPDPSALLVRANGAFADGDLQVALDEVRQADGLLEGAQTAGIVRLVSAAVVLVAGLGFAIWLLRRRAVLHR